MRLPKALLMKEFGLAWRQLESTKRESTDAAAFISWLKVWSNQAEVALPGRVYKLDLDITAKRLYVFVEPSLS